MSLYNCFKWFNVFALILGISFFISSCQPKTVSSNEYVSNITASFLRDTLADSSFELTEYYMFRDSVFVEQEFIFDTISEIEFQKYKQKTRLDCQLDSGIRVGKNSIYLKTRCNEVCSNTLVFPEHHQELVLTCDYDAGILGALLSPNHKQFLVFAGYDGADFVDYYDKRSVIQLFNYQKRKGALGVKPVAVFGLTDWSIEDFCWVSNDVAAFKVFSESRWEVSDSLRYNYFKVNLKSF